MIAQFPDSLRLLLIFLVACTVTWVLIPYFAHLANRIGLVDLPNARKVHRRPRPLVGGLVMGIGVMAAGLLFPMQGLLGYFAGAVLLVLIGFLDDYREVDHRVKFIAQILAAALIIAFSGAYLGNMGNLLGWGEIRLGVFALPLTVFAVVGVCNAMNMMDGMDGLAGSLALTTFAAMALLVIANGLNPQHAMLALAMCGVLVAFLRYNWRPASLFMGDAGSLMLGFTAAFLAVVITQGPTASVRPVIPLLLLAVPITDTLVIMTRRLMRGKSPFHPDKAHMHHILLRMGFLSDRVVQIMIGITLLFALVAVMGEYWVIAEHYLFIFFLGYFFLIFFISFRIVTLTRWVWKIRRRLSNGVNS